MSETIPAELEMGRFVRIIGCVSKDEVHFLYRQRNCSHN